MGRKKRRHLSQAFIVFQFKVLLKLIYEVIMNLHSDFLPLGLKKVVKFIQVINWRQFHKSTVNVDIEEMKETASDFATSMLVGFSIQFNNFEWQKEVSITAAQMLVY